MTREEKYNKIAREIVDDCFPGMNQIYLEKRERLQQRIRRELLKLENELLSSPLVKELEGSYPVVLFLKTEQDRDELFEAVRQAKPGMEVRKL